MTEEKEEEEEGDEDDEERERSETGLTSEQGTIPPSIESARKKISGDEVRTQRYSQFSL